MATPVTFDPKELESTVKAMYRSVAENPDGEFHFEMGRAMATNWKFGNTVASINPATPSS